MDPEVANAVDRPSYEELAALVVAQEKQIAHLTAEIADLKRRLSMSSRNSSKPPSSDGYSKPNVNRSLRRKSGRKRGGQPGSSGHHLAQVSTPDEHIIHDPESCDCGESLDGGAVEGVSERQVFDLPPEVRLMVSSHLVTRRRCCCGQVTAGRFPEGVNAPTQYGQRLRALVIYLSNFQHLPYERISQLLADCYGARLSTGTLKMIVTLGAAGLEGFLEEVRSQLSGAPVVHFDETGARVDGRLAWVHSASTDSLTLYNAHPKRGSDAMNDAGVLPAFTGTAVHDGWSSYRHYEKARHALCNAHHLRELKAVIEHSPQIQSWAQVMTDLLYDIKDIVNSAKTAEFDRLPTQTLTEFHDCYREVIACGYQQNPPPKPTGKRGRAKRTKTANLLCRLDEGQQDVLRFATDFRVPFDNNQAERDIRMIKLQQKISGSWRTTAGAHDFMATRSYISTARKQGQEILAILNKLVTGQPWLPTVTPMNTGT